MATITVGLDGTCMLMCEDGWREAMVGTLGLYNKDGERLHTVYTAATPEYGKLTSFERFDREVDRVKAAYPEALYVGVADGAKENWLVPGHGHAKAGRGLLPRDAVHRQGGRSAVRRGWRGAPGVGRFDWCHRLKHEVGAAASLIADMKDAGSGIGQGKRLPAEVDSALTLLRQSGQGGPDGVRGDGGRGRSRSAPGVTEAACKVSNQTAAMWFGDALEGARGGGGVELEMPELHGRSLGSVLVACGSFGVPGGGVRVATIITCFPGRTPCDQM